MKYKDFENMSCIDILLKVLYSVQFLKEEDKPEDALTKGEITEAMIILREKIENDPKKPVRIQTVWGVGYKFV